MSSSPSSISRYYTDAKNPKGWGFFMWNCIDWQLESYPENPTEDDQKELEQWMYLTFRKIPCESCSEHALQLLKHYPITTSSRASVKEWWIFIHNQVNAMLDRKQLSPNEAHKHNNLIRHINWEAVWNDLKSGKLDISSGSSTRIFYGISTFILLIIFIAVFLAWIKDNTTNSSNNNK